MFSTLGNALLDRSILFSFDRHGFRRHAQSFLVTDLQVSLQGRRYLVTGANSGIGFETALGLSRLGAEVLLACRSVERGQAAALKIEAQSGRLPLLYQVDMGDMRSVRALVEKIEAPIDVLVHNAGVLPDALSCNAEGVEQTAAVHLQGPHLLTRDLPLRAGGRVIWVSSGGMYTTRLDVGALQKPPMPYDGVKAYAQTKRAQVVLAELWAERLAAQEVSVFAMHPGWADTPAVQSSLPSFHRWMASALRSSAEGADTVLWLAACQRIQQQSGLFWFDRQVVSSHLLPWTQEDSAERARLWAWCEEHCKR